MVLIYAAYLRFLGAFPREPMKKVLTLQAKGIIFNKCLAVDR
jgi:hypothetical protein